MTSIKTPRLKLKNMSYNNTLPENEKPFKIKPQLVEEIRSIINVARQKAVTAVNSAMVFAYWEIGKRIAEEEQGGKNRAQYGKYLLRELAKALSSDLGKNFDTRELRRICQFYFYFPIRDAVSPELTWSHYRLLLRIENDQVRQFYLKESIGQHWSTRKLERNINSQYYQRMLSSRMHTTKHQQIKINSLSGK